MQCNRSDVSGPAARMQSGVLYYSIVTNFTNFRGQNTSPYADIFSSSQEIPAFCGT
jgi:hypothetical protein